jgi:hypothetical protein
MFRAIVLICSLASGPIPDCPIPAFEIGLPATSARTWADAETCKREATQLALEALPPSLIDPSARIKVVCEPS